MVVSVATEQPPQQLLIDPVPPPVPDELEGVPRLAQAGDLRFGALGPDEGITLAEDDQETGGGEPVAEGVLVEVGGDAPRPEGHPVGPHLPTRDPATGDGGTLGVAEEVEGDLLPTLPLEDPRVEGVEPLDLVGDLPLPIDPGHPGGPHLATRTLEVEAREAFGSDEEAAGGTNRLEGGEEDLRGVPVAVEDEPDLPDLPRRIAEDPVARASRHPQALDLQIVHLPMVTKPPVGIAGAIRTLIFMRAAQDENLTGWRARGHEIIFESDTPAGRTFDIALILAILLSLAVVMLESVRDVAREWGGPLRTAEWIFTILFTIEYLLRLACVGRPARYARSFFGIVDLASILPTWVSALIPGAQVFLVVRTLRILRVFRVLKLAAYVTEADTLMRALRASRRKIAVFLFAVFAIVIIFGSIMFLIEGPENGFTSIPRGIYWAVVTLTTVGYGDISPQTSLGQTISAFIMVLGYGIIAIPTGIVTAELTSARLVSGQACPQCSTEGHDPDAAFCKGCGARL
jgi:voltage-gated potassium channel